VKQWTGTQNGTPVTIGTTQIAMLSFSGSERITMLRLRGSLLVVATPNAAADNDYAAFGVIVVSDQALAVGGTSIPGPIANPEAPWVWHQYVPLMDVVSTAADAASIGLNHVVEIDSKAMRKVGPNDSIVLIGELATGEMADVAAIGAIRLLQLLG